MDLLELIEQRKVLTVAEINQERELVKDIQQSLIAIGKLEEGQDDGIWGPITQAAAFGFAKEVHLNTPTTELIGPTFGRLLRKEVQLALNSEIPQAAIDTVKKFEGVHLEAYICPAGVWTIGYGTTRDVRPGMVITQERAEVLLIEDMKSSLKTVRTYTQVELNSNQLSALTSFVYNVGSNAYLGSTLLRKLNKGLYKEAANQFPRWKFSKTKILAGLVRRRQFERELFLTEI